MKRSNNDTFLDFVFKGDGRYMWKFVGLLYATVFGVTGLACLIDHMF